MRQWTIYKDEGPAHYHQDVSGPNTQPIQVVDKADYDALWTMAAQLAAACTRNPSSGSCIEALKVYNKLMETKK